MARYSAREYSRALRSLINVPAQVAKDVVKEINFEIQAGFDAGRDPYRRPWAPLAPSTLKRRPWRGFPPLTDTREGRRGVKAKAVSGAGVQITSSVAHLNVHQFGNPPRLPARPFLPKGVLPKSWAARYQAQYLKKFRATIG